MKRFYILIVLLLLLCRSSIAAQGVLKWVTVGKMPLQVSFSQAVVKDSLIYIMGGYSDSLMNWVNTIQEYNPKTNTWRIAGNMVSRRGGFYADVYKDSIFMVGGSSAGAGLRPTIEFWNLKSKPYIWRSHEWMARNYFAGARFKDKFYVFGGYQFLESPPINHYLVEYDIKTAQTTYYYDSVFTSLAMPAQQMACVVDSAAYLFGGYFQFALANVFIFDFTTRSLKKLTYRMTEPRYEGKVIYTGNKTMYLIGGQNESVRGLPRTTKYLVNGQNITAEEGPELVVGRQSFSAVLYNGAIYVFGGKNNHNDGIGTVEKLELDPNAVETPPVGGAVDGYVLHDNYPNPFNPSTTISFGMQKSGDVRIVIFDILGRQIKELANGRYVPGNHSVQWNATDNFGEPVVSGVYLCRMYVNNQSFTKKMLYVR